MTDVTDAEAAASAYQQMAMGAMLDLAAPQERYLDLIAQGGFVEPMPGMALSFSRANTEYVLRHAEEFSSVIDMNLGNVRPMIPLNVDPPMHSKYRKLLDPLFAPRRMDEQEEDITRRVNGFIDSFIDRGECNFSEEFAELFPSSVFLGLMGLPEDEMRMFLRMRDGILHPEKWDENALVDGDARAAVTTAAGAEIYEYFGNLIDERTAQPAEDIITRFVKAEIDGERLTKEEILDICFLFLIAGLDTVSDTLTCSYAFLATHPEHRQMIVDDPVDHPARGGGAAAVGVAGSHRCAADRAMPGRPSERRPRRAGHRGDAELRRREHGSRRRTTTRWTFASTARTTRTSRSAVVCTVASVRTSRGGSCGSRCASGIAASPSTASSPGTRRSSTRPASAT